MPHSGLCRVSSFLFYSCLPLLPSVEVQGVTALPRAPLGLFATKDDRSCWSDSRLIPCPEKIHTHQNAEERTRQALGKRLGTLVQCLPSRLSSKHRFACYRNNKMSSAERTDGQRKSSDSDRTERQAKLPTEKEPPYPPTATATTPQTTATVTTTTNTATQSNNRTSIPPLAQLQPSVLQWLHLSTKTMMNSHRWIPQSWDPGQ